MKIPLKKYISRMVKYISGMVKDRSKAVVASVIFMIVLALFGGAAWAGYSFWWIPKQIQGQKKNEAQKRLEVLKRQRSEQAKEKKDAFRFISSRVEKSLPGSRACFRFNASLKSLTEESYGKYFRIHPQINSPVYVVGHELCVNGLNQGKSYDIVLRKGLPDNFGSHLQEEKHLRIATSPFALSDYRLNEKSGFPVTCFDFNEYLDPSVGSSYGNYIIISPQIKPSFEILANRLCMKGMKRNVTYDVVLRKGLPDRYGSHLQEEKHLQITTAPFVFRNMKIDSTSFTPKACLYFGGYLDSSGNTSYERYVEFSPQIKPTFEINDEELCVKGIERGVAYKVVLREGLPDNLGSRLGKDESFLLSINDLPPLISFPSKGFIFPRKSMAGIPIETVNVERLLLRIIRIGERSVGRVKYLNFDKKTLEAHEIRSFIQDSGALVWEGEMPVLHKPNQKLTTLFPLSKLWSSRKLGAYILVAKNAAETEGKSPSRSVAVQWIVNTDMGITTFRGSDGLSIAVRSFKSASPLPGVDVSIFAVNNEELSKTTTNDMGLARFEPGLLRGTGGMAPTVIMAYGPNNDFALLDLRRPGFDLSDRGVGGRSAPGALDPFMYTDRGIYRPGETVHLVSLLRDKSGNRPIKVPLTFFVTRPNGSEYGRFVVQSTGTGANALDINLPNNASRGIWEISIRSSKSKSDQVIGKISFDVQDFIPQRLKVIASPGESSLMPGELFKLNVSGAFLYGAKASNLSGEVDWKVLANLQPFKGFEGFKFGNHKEFKALRGQMKIPATDKEGNTQVDVTIKNIEKVIVPLKVEFSPALVEPGGRVTRTKIMVPMVGKSPFVGIRPHFSDGAVAEGVPAVFDVVLLDPSGEKIKRSTLKYSLYEESWGYNWYYLNGSWRYRGFRRGGHPQKNGEIEMPSDGMPGMLSIPLEWGHYQLIVKDTVSDSKTSMSFQVGYGENNDADTPDKAVVSVGKSAYKIGEIANVNIIAPFAGQLLISIASHKVFDTFTVDIPQKGRTVQIPVREEWGAGAYVIATAYRPILNGHERGPVRAVGLAWISVDNHHRTLSVDMDFPEKLRPRQKYNLPVMVNGLDRDEVAYVTVSAVDEGILQLTRFKTPKASNHYFGKRALAIKIRDDYSRLLLGKGVMGRPRSGGDEYAPDGNIGGVGLPVVPTKSVSLFSGLIKLGKDGKTQIPFELPDFNGQLRLMAVVHSAGKVGEGERQLIVRDPIVGDLSLPRFLAPGDDGRMTLLVHNIDGQDGNYHLRLSADGAVSLSEKWEKDRHLDVNEKFIETIPLYANNVGIGTVRMEIRGPDGIEISRIWQITVRPPHMPILLEEVALHKNGSSFHLDHALLAPFLPNTQKVSVNYSSSNVIDVSSMLQSLDRYPYGCTEQITSKALPLLAFHDPTLVDKSSRQGREKKLIREKVQRAIFTLLERQDRSGAIGLWRAGDRMSSPFLAAYVTDFLWRAKKSGYIVPDYAMSQTFNWIRSNLNHGTAFNANAYAFYVLARAGRARIGELRYFHDNQLDNLEGPLAPAMLGAALTFVGEKNRSANAFSKVLPNIDQAIGLRNKKDYYSSSLREIAGSLAMAAEAKNENIVKNLLARFGGKRIKGESMNTQEKAWLLQAASNLKSSGTVRIAVNDIERDSLGGPVAFHPSAKEVEKGYKLSNFSGRDVWRTLIVGGVPRVAPPAIYKGLTVRRNLFAFSGSKVDPLKVSQNDRFIVVLEGENKTEIRRQVILVDLLPAGWEIEGIVSRRRNNKTDWHFLEKMTRMAMHEIRDDRFVASFNLSGNNKNHGDSSFRVAYIVRAVTPGRYVLPAPVIEDMYRPQVMARGLTRKAVVK